MLFRFHFSFILVVYECTECIHPSELILVCLCEIESFFSSMNQNMLFFSRSNFGEQ